jgi:hypothetical protein
MEKVIFACMAPSHGPGLESEVPLLVSSIRTFAGSLSGSPVWVLIPQSENEIPEETQKRFVSLNVEVIPLKIDPDIVAFPFAAYVLAAATAESLALEHTELLAWMGIDTLILNSPASFLLEEDKSAGYRPVHHTLIGSIYENPPDPFWELVYRKCHVPQDALFPMHPHVDHNTIRPYFNAGHLIVRPEKGILRKWWDYFKKIYGDPSCEDFYEKNELYSIFIHQAVLTGVILSSLKRDELQELPFTYNYPLHLYQEAPQDLKPGNINELVTVRYEEPGVLKTIPFQGPVKSWLRDNIKS